MEEANELRDNIERLEGELVELKAEIAAKEDANNQLSKEGEGRSEICIINHTLPSTIRAVIGTLTCTSMASNSTSDSECY